MAEKQSIQELLEQSEDQLFRRIIDEQEGALGFSENRSLDSPSNTELARWAALLDQLEMAQTVPSTRHRKWGRTTLLIAAVAILLAITVMAFHGELLNFIETVQEQFTQYSPDESPEDIVSGWENAFLPEYIPSGYLMSDAYSNGDTRVIEYSNSSGVRFTFYQSGPHTVTRIDTESASLEDCQIGLYSGRLVQKNGLSTLGWSTTDAAFFIEYHGDQITNAEIKQIAESVIKINKKEK